MWSAILILTIAELSVQAATEYNCEKLQATHQSCYQFIQENKVWHDALEYCQERGGELLSVNDIGEQKSLERKLGTLGRWSYWWVGLTMETSSSQWVWLDGGDLNTSITKWGPGEPNNVNGQETCATVRTVRTVDKGLNDLNCDTLRWFICEKQDTNSCRDDQFMCTDGSCILKDWRCDDEDDCGDMSDEKKCPKATFPTTSTITTTPTTGADATPAGQGSGGSGGAVTVALAVSMAVVVVALIASSALNVWFCRRRRLDKAARTYDAPDRRQIGVREDFTELRSYDKSAGPSAAANEESPYDIAT